MDTITVSPSNLELTSLLREQPGLKYESNLYRITGTLLVSAEYDHSTGSFTILPQPSGNSETEYIHTEIQIDVNLRFQPTTFNPWPTVSETGGRVQEIMRTWDIGQITDLHCYPDNPRNVCCLGIESYTGKTVEVTPFISRMVVPFFYRLAYVEQHGLEAGRKRLWAEYSHGNDGYREYATYAKTMLKRRRNSLCICQSGRKYKRCCRPGFEMAARIFREFDSYTP